LPFGDGEFDEIHAYEVLEHLGSLGDWRFFCSEWNEYYRILKPGGYFFGTVPHMNSKWLFGDPSHTRVITKETLIFLEQRQYTQVGRTSMSDFRHWYHGDFGIAMSGIVGESFRFILQRL